MTKDQLREAINLFLDSVRDSDSIHINALRGVNEIEPRDGFAQFELNDTATVTILINGGAQERRWRKLPADRLITMTSMMCSFSKHTQCGLSSCACRCHE